MRFSNELCAIAIAVTFVYALAETWQIDSAPFVWPGSGVAAIAQPAAAAGDLFSWRCMPGKKIVFSCALPRVAARDAAVQFRIYALDGTLIYSSSHPAGVSSIVWDYSAGAPRAAATYIASITTGAFERTLTVTDVR